VVGDWIAIATGADPPLVRAILPRHSALVRRRPGKTSQGQVLAANIDTVVVVDGLDRGPNPRRIERAVALAWDAGATPLVVLTKADLCADPEQAVATASAAAPHVEVVLVSAHRTGGLTDLSDLLGQGSTSVLLGPSGAGKSTLVNALLGEERMAVGEVRSADGRGRHTTTRRELIVLPCGACLIDTPGVRELGLWLDAEAVDSAFPDIESLAVDCRFRDCRHQQEPGCAVRAAVNAGELDPARLDSYLRLRAEAESLEHRRSTAGNHEQRARDRVFARIARTAKRIKGDR
jgi:ribosome biogenesis GTPase